MRKSLRVVATALVFAAILLPSCDGGDTPDEDKSATSGLTRTELIQQVDEICTKGRAQLKDLEPPKNLKESSRFLRQILPIIREQLTWIRGLGEPPEDGRSVYLQWIEARDGIVETTARMIAAAEEGDRSEFERLAAIQQDLDTQADKAAKAYGFKVCGVTSEPDAAPPSPAPSS